MDEKIIVAILGAMFGFSLPYLANVWDRVRRAHCLISALDRELLEVTTEIQKKMAWVSRDISKLLNEVDKDRIVEANGIYLYLGEREEFLVPRDYWKAKYTEIAEAISDKDFSDFYVMYRMVDRFEHKFREMKLTFDTTSGKKDVMALACFNDLTVISKDLQSRLTDRLSRHT